MKKFLLLGMVIAGLILSSCGKSYDESMVQGTDHIKAEKYQEALESFDNAIKKASTDVQRVEAKINAGNMSSLYLHDMELANSYYQSTLENISEYSSADIHDLARQALAAQANKAAVNLFKLWLEKFPDDENVLNRRYELAEVYHKNVRDLRSAIKAYGEIVDEYPETEQAPKALFSIGYIYANELGEDSSATVAYTKFIEKYPDHEMAPSVEFELKYLGKSLEEIPELQHLLTKTS
ncbi:MAG: tetratricopeptide repeat protein [Candidatus Marinimicrobia bacterium]|nr:tetratricopeptide repeat protein [Candidatus Neomarinimicrobiota bacterium]